MKRKSLPSHKDNAGTASALQQHAIPNAAEKQLSRSHDKRGWRIPEWSQATGLSRSFIYQLLKDGVITGKKAGAARIITTDPADYLSSLEN